MHVQGVLDSEVLTDPNDSWFEWEGARGTSPLDWRMHPELVEGDKIRFAFGGFLLRSGPLDDRVVLIDVGNGPESDGFIPEGRFPSALRACGVEPGDVTDVLLTHLHYDHTGWLGFNGAPMFPKATVHAAAADLSWFSAPGTPGLSAAVTPERFAVVAEHLTTFDGSCTPVPGISAIPAPGHTPGSTVYVASDGLQRVVFLGDVVHCPVQLVDSEWAVLGDVDPVLAAQTRRNLERELDGADVAGAHFPGLSLGRVISGVGKKQWHML